MTQIKTLAWGIGILAVVALGIAVWQFASSDRERPVAAKLGALLPLTGDLSSFGEATLKGVELAVVEVNAAGGVLDGILELITADTQTSPQAGMIAGQKLAGVDGVSGIVGAMASGVTIPVAQSVAAVSVSSRPVRAARAIVVEHVCLTRWVRTDETLEARRSPSLVLF